MANRDIGRRFDEQPTRGACVQTAHSSATRNGYGEAGESSHRQPRAMPTSNLQPRTELRPLPTTAALARADERQRLARDLHDGVQNELLSLILKIKMAEEDRTTLFRARRTFVDPRSRGCDPRVQRDDLAYARRQYSAGVDRRAG